jgi:dTDP-4-dehydrorhamnose 3,5-epimerase
MIAHEQSIPDVKIIELKVLGDQRGWFCESYKESAWSKLLHGKKFVQDNQSFSAAPWTLRGIHFQRHPFAQAKLVQVLQGEIFDVAVDLRRASPTFGRWVGAILRAGDGLQFFIPEGFGHAFVTLRMDSLIQYKVTAPYVPDSEGGLMWNDPSIGIEWPEMPAPPTLSTRDMNWRPLSDDTPLF